MRVVFINRFYWPEETATAQLLTDLATALAGNGHEVEVITARTQPNLVARETCRGVSIRRLGRAQKTDVNLSGKLWDYSRFLAGIFWHLLWRRRNPDTIVALSDPPLLGAVVWLATGWRRAAVIHWVHDIYPEIAVELGGPGWLNGLRPWRNLAWRRSAGCVVPGETMQAVVRSSGVRADHVMVCPNWALPELQPLPAERVLAARARLGIGTQFVAAYSGNLGRAHSLDPLLEVAERLRDDQKFLLLLIGRGPQRSQLEATVVKRGLTNVRFLESQPRQLLAETLSVADVHFVTLKPGMERWVFPSKLSGIVSAGRPVIFLGNCDSEIARLITQNGWGRCFSPDHISDAAEELRLLERNPDRLRRFANAARTQPLGNFTVALGRWTTLLNHAKPPRLASETAQP